MVWTSEQNFHTKSGICRKNIDLFLPIHLYQEVICLYVPEFWASSCSWIWLFVLFVVISNECYQYLFNISDMYNKWEQNSLYSYWAVTVWG